MSESTRHPPKSQPGRDGETLVSSRLLPKRLYAAIAAAALVVGLAGRLWLVSLAPQHGYNWDHMDNVGMGLAAEKVGLLHVYSITREQLPIIPAQVWQDERFVPIERQNKTLPNYPPLCMVLFWLQAKVMEAIWSPLTVNTFGTRLVAAVLPTIAELLTAIGVMLLVRDLTGRRGPALLAGIVTWLFPPIMMNTDLWGQVDSFLLAPSIFMILFMARGRWVAAGLCLAAAALLKPQGLVLGPIVLLGAVLGPAGQTDLPVADRYKQHFKLILLRLIKFGVAALAAIVIFAAPWMASDGLAWFDRCYVLSFLEAFPRTTMMAFNIWYVDALAGDRQPSFTVWDSAAGVGGFTKDGWGRAMLIAAMIVLAILCWRKYRRQPARALVIFSALWLWSIFIWPTRVHERFIIYCIPPMIALAAAMKRYWPAVLGLLIIGMVEHSWNVWMKDLPVAGSFNEPTAASVYQNMLAQYRAQAARLPSAAGLRLPTPTDAVNLYWRHYRQQREELENWEILATVLSLGSYGWAVVVAMATVAGKAQPAGASAKKLRLKR